MKNAFLPTLAAAVLLMSASVAQAVTVSYGFATPADGSGKTSTLAGNANVFVETFDKADGTGGQTLAANYLSVTTVSGGGFGYAKGDLAGVYAAPANDVTNYAYGPKLGSGSNSAEVNFNFAGLLTELNKADDTSSLNYFGLYYGSIDTFNDVVFYNKAGQIIQTITGASLISQFGGTSGDTDANSSNIYVNLFFSEAEQFSSFSFKTTTPAFEIDNLVVGYKTVNPVPEPGSLALLALGLAGVGFAARRNKKA